MAFDSIPGIKIISHLIDYTYIIGDFFAVYEKSHTDGAPLIYCWSEVKAINETRTDFNITTPDAVYTIPKACFIDDKKFLALRGILEGVISNNPGIEYTYLKRILPPKNLYVNGDIENAPYLVHGFYKDREINLSNVILLNIRIGNIFKIVAGIAMIVVFVLLHFFWGNTEANWFYFLPVSVFSGGIAVMLVYLVCAVIANYHFTALFKVDPALNEEITFAVSADGFSSVESFLFTGHELIPWHEAAFFVETNHVFIIYKNHKAVFWLPKRFFEKERQVEISKFIAERLLQK